jgi:hypothetical protein
MHAVRVSVRFAIAVVAVWYGSLSALAQQTPAAVTREGRPLRMATAQTDEPADASAIPARRDGWHGRIEIKRQNTSRGTPEESTKTTVRLESFLEGSVSLLRLDLPFPDEETDFSGSPFSPRLGDIKTRVGFRAVPAYGVSFPSFIEVTFPTADPESLGSGKYQLSAAIRMLAPVSPPFLAPASHKSRFEAQLQQVNSVAGDSERKDINHTKIELTLSDVWREEYTWKLKLKPTVDWIENGETGAVSEVEGGVTFARGWRTWLMLGRRIWGPEGVPATYDTRVELNVAWTY